MRKHPLEAQPDGPSAQCIDHGTSRQRERDAIRQPTGAMLVGKFMPMYPSRERALHLFINKQPIGYIFRVRRDPCDGADANHHAGPGPDAPGSTDHRERREGG